MRWERLFVDLAAQYDAAADADLAGEVADRSRREVALIRLADRLRAADGPVAVGVAGHPPVAGDVAGVGADWVLLAEAGREVLVPLGAVQWVQGMPVRAVANGGLTARLDLGYVLRGIARDRAPVSLGLRDASIVVGTIDRVGADFLDIAEHATDELRRPDMVRSARAVAFGAIGLVRRATGGER